MKNKMLLIISVFAIVILVLGCTQETKPRPENNVVEENGEYPKIASLNAKKDELISSKKPFDLVMHAWFTPEEAEQFKQNNPNVILLAGLSVNWVWDNKDWLKFLSTVSNYGKSDPIKITEDMYLHKENGKRCAFGWESEKWGHEEIYSMDPRNGDWVEYITSFYKIVLDQPQHNGINVDMVVEEQFWCPDAISREEWLSATKAIFENIHKLNTENKLVIFNAGRYFADINEYAQYFDGYLMENFMGSQLKTVFDDGLKAANSDLIVIYGVDTDDTGEQDLNKMRLGLTLSLLNDNTYFIYDFGPRDHGQAWWFKEYDADLGKPIGNYYKKDNAYYRKFENAVVVAAPDGAKIEFEQEYIDVTTGNKSNSFTIEKGDGRIFVLNPAHAGH